MHAAWAGCTRHRPRDTIHVDCGWGFSLGLAMQPHTVKQAYLDGGEQEERQLLNQHQPSEMDAGPGGDESAWRGCCKGHKKEAWGLSTPHTGEGRAQEWRCSCCSQPGWDAGLSHLLYPLVMLFHLYGKSVLVLVIISVFQPQFHKRHTHVYTQPTETHTNTYRNANTKIDTNTHINTHINKHMPTHTHANAYTQVEANTKRNTNPYTEIQKHTQKHEETNTKAYRNAHRETHTCRETKTHRNTNTDIGTFKHTQKTQKHTQKWRLKKINKHPNNTYQHTQIHV